jgi:hypothetical protein
MINNKYTMKFRDGLVLFFGLICQLIGSITGINDIFNNKIPSERDAKINKWNYTKYIVTNYTLETIKCCKKDLCKCQQINNVSTCFNMLFSLQEGFCDNGEYCCAQQCAICFQLCDSCPDKWFGCSKDRPCNPYDCNCRCTADIDNQKCSIICGQCYTVTNNISYYINDELYSTLLINNCGQDNTDCLNYVLGKYPINSSSVLWYEKHNISNIMYAKPVFSYSSSYYFYIIVVIYVAIINLAFIVYVKLLQEYIKAMCLYKMIMNKQINFFSKDMWYLFIKAFKNNGINSQIFIDAFDTCGNENIAIDLPVPINNQVITNKNNSNSEVIPNGFAESKNTDNLDENLMIEGNPFEQISEKNLLESSEPVSDENNLELVEIENSVVIQSIILNADTIKEYRACRKSLDSFLSYGSLFGFCSVCMFLVHMVLIIGQQS